MNYEILNEETEKEGEMAGKKCKTGYARSKKIGRCIQKQKGIKKPKRHKTLRDYILGR